MKICTNTQSITLTGEFQHTETLPHAATQKTEEKAQDEKADHY